MPPQRTVPPPRPVKTERTHEENQERAYIAASRRSDRSLEARVESARRASEIHKRRTGRSLRVTEQDVVNEEMYEEEDDDMPLRFRGMSSHLQTNNEEFNRRLSAYIANQIAMRDTHQMFASQFPHVPQYPQNQQALYQSSLLAQQYQQQLMMQQQQQQLNNSTLSPGGSYRQTPYAIPNMQQSSSRPNMIHGRSASIATPQSSTAGGLNSSPLTSSMKMESPRRMSTTDASPQPSSLQIKTETTTQSPASYSFQQFTSGPFANHHLGSNLLSASPTFDALQSPHAPSNANFLTTELPFETQQLLVDPTAMGSMYSSGQSWFSNPSPYTTSSLTTSPLNKNSSASAPFVPHGGVIFTEPFLPAVPTMVNGITGAGVSNTSNPDGAASTPPRNGLNTTLAPTDTSLGLGLGMGIGMGNMGMGMGEDFGYGGSAGGMGFFEAGIRESGFEGGSGAGTPGQSGFDLFIEPNSWEPTSSQ